MTHVSKKIDLEAEDYIQCVVDSAYGIYCPQVFATRFGDILTPVAREVLGAGPDHPEYWDIWDQVLQTQTATDTDGTVWYFTQDADVFMIRDDTPDAILEAFHA